jgi:cobalt/nickel transport system ATP-binding protein
MDNIAIELINVTYIYPDGTVALKDVNLKILKGERVAILGPNGSGKSTLLTVMAGLLKPYKGEIRNSNNSRIGLAFQDPDDQLFCPTLLEDIAFGPLNMGLPKEKAFEKANEVLKAVGLEELKDKPPHRLSVGEKKKASIATVLAMEPEVIALDEPTSNLDPKSRKELISLINELFSKRNFTLIIATHDMTFANKVAEKAYILNKGRIVANGKLTEILSNFKLLEEVGLYPF